MAGPFFFLPEAIKPLTGPKIFANLPKSVYMDEHEPRNLYRRAAKRLFPTVDVAEEAHVQIVAEGAFVEVIVWVPARELTKEINHARS